MPLHVKEFIFRSSLYTPVWIFSPNISLESMGVLVGVGVAVTIVGVVSVEGLGLVLFDEQPAMDSIIIKDNTIEVNRFIKFLLTDKNVKLKELINIIH